MYKGLRIAAVVPAHNEAAHIEEVISTMPDTVDVIAITDDVSSDDTFNIAKSTGDPRVIVIKHKKNTGVGGAIITAHGQALEQNCDINVVFAGDGQMDPKYLSNLLDPIIEGKCGYTKGNRLFSKKSTEGMPKYRIFGNRVLSYMNKAISGYWSISDPQNGYTAITAEVLKEIDYKTISAGYEFENDMLARLNVYSIPVIDINIPALYRDEVSGIKLSKVVPALLKNFFVSYFRRMYKKYVLKKSIIPTILLLSFFATFIYSIFELVNTNYSKSIASLSLMLLSLIFLTFYDFKSEPKVTKKIKKTVN